MKKGLILVLSVIILAASVIFYWYSVRLLEDAKQLKSDAYEILDKSYRVSSDAYFDMQRFNDKHRELLMRIDYLTEQDSIATRYIELP